MRSVSTFDNLRTRKQQLEQYVAQCLSEEQREQLEGELTKSEIALSFLDQVAVRGVQRRPLY